MNETIFRAYDVRGKYPSEINPIVVLQITAALSRYFRSRNKRRPKMVVARDGRLGSTELYKAVVKGLQGVGVVQVGLTTTPMFYFLVARLKAAGGVMITASHSPKEYNGLKVVGKNARMMAGREILKIMKKES